MTFTHLEERRGDLDRSDLGVTGEHAFDINEGDRNNREYFESLLGTLEAPGDWLLQGPSPLASDQIDWSQFDEETRAAGSVEFVQDWERKFARTMDAHNVTWLYKPRTFAVEWDDEGNFVDSFTPDFYLPEQDLYIDLVPPGYGVSSTKARKVRMLRQQYSRVTIILIHGTDYRYVVDEIAAPAALNHSPRYFLTL